ncbi:hypothetical protein POM88_048558 [Heracleum sosnowskyi]|uniref:Uncharacterized protein n=1 Tax=Heracleum sosnowskyi TaxID=360622 RepID=A0AAD8GW24_9APIA|nr:hypothetical protein POM88_048558 [Heracleum sosnowskyi]
MRSPFRRQVKPIGAKWLQTGYEDSNSNSRVEDHVEQDGEDDSNQDPKNQGVVSQGGNQGDRIFQNGVKGAGLGGSNIQTNPIPPKAQINKNDAMILVTRLQSLLIYQEILTPSQSGSSWFLIIESRLIFKLG